MPALVDTSIRLLAQEPLAGLMPTAELLRLAEILDKSGFAYLEVSGGGVFDTAVRRGVESRCETMPWLRRDPRMAALRSDPRYGPLLAALGDVGTATEIVGGAPTER